MQTTTLITRLCITLGIFIIALLCNSVLRRSRITSVLVHLLELRPVLNSKRTPTRSTSSVISRSSLLAFSTSLSLTTLLHLLYMNQQSTKVHVVSCNMSSIHSSSNFYDTPVTNLLIPSLLLETREEAYFESITNIKKYSLINIPTSHRLMNSSNLTYLISLGKNFSLNAFFRMSQVMGTASSSQSSTHILYHT